MPASKVNFETKENFKISPLENKFKGRAENWNELRDKHNENADIIDENTADIDINEQDIAINAQAINDNAQAIQANTDLANQKVASVQPGSNIVVDNADPQNPIISSFTGTSAGIITPLFVTGEEETLSAGTFYKTLRNDRGSVASVQQVVVSPDDTIEYFLQDAISIPAISDGEIPVGSYGGFFSVQRDSTSGDAVRFGCEVYLADADGNVTDVGVPAGNPIGSYGVRIMAFISTGNVEPPINSETQENVVGVVPEAVPYSTGQRFRYRFFGEKVGTQGASVTLTIYFGFDHNTYLEVPVINTTDDIFNNSKNPGATSTDALNSLYDKATPQIIIGDWDFLADWDESAVINPGEIRNLSGEPATANAGMFFNPIDKNGVDHTPFLQANQNVQIVLNWIENGVLKHTIINAIAEFYDSVSTEWWFYWDDPPNTGNVFDFGTYPANGTVISLKIPTYYIIEAPNDGNIWIRQNRDWNRALIPQVDLEGGDNIVRLLTNTWAGVGTAVANGIVGFTNGDWLSNSFTNFAFSQFQSGGTSELPFIQTLDGKSVTLVDSEDTANIAIVDQMQLTENPAGTWVASSLLGSFSFPKGSPSNGINLIIGSPFLNLTTIKSSDNSVEISQTDLFNFDIKAKNPIQLKMAMSDNTTDLVADPINPVYADSITTPFNMVGYIPNVIKSPLTQDILIDVRKNGTSVFSGTLYSRIAPGDKVGTSGTIVGGSVNFDYGDFLEVYLLQVGIGTPGAGLKGDPKGFLINT